jgi:hypothetical protein
VGLHLPQDKPLFPYEIEQCFKLVERWTGLDMLLPGSKEIVHCESVAALEPL